MSLVADAGRLARAYPAMLRVGVAGALAYRFETVVWMLTTTMPLVSLALWSAVAEGGPIGGYAQPELVSYFLAALVVRQVTGCWLVWQMSMEIKSGALSQRLLRPIHPFLGYSAELLGAMPLRLVLSVPVSMAALAWGTAALPTDPLLWLVWAASLLGAWLINFFIMALVGTMAFYFDSATSLFDVYLVGFMLLSGYIAPLSVFPPWVGRAAAVSPFRYTLAFPVELVIGRMGRGQALTELATQWGMVLGLGLLATAVFRRGVRRYSAFGA